MITWNDIAGPVNMEATARALGGDYDQTLASLRAEGARSALYPTLRLLAHLYCPKRYLEIGVYRGQSALAVAAGCSTVSEIVGIDNWTHPKALNPHQARAVIEAGYAGNLTLFAGDSVEILTPNLGIFDLILVDGDHAPNAMAADLNAAAPLLAPGGHFVAHDVFASHAPACTVVWEQFKEAHPSWQWYEHKVGPGIGVGRSPST